MKASIFPKWSRRVGSQIVTSIVGKICHALSRLTFRAGCSSPTQDIADAARDATCNRYTTDRDKAYIQKRRSRTFARNCIIIFEGANALVIASPHLPPPLTQSETRHHSDLGHFHHRTNPASGRGGACGLLRTSACLFSREN